MYEKKDAYLESFKVIRVCIHSYIRIYTHKDRCIYEERERERERDEYKDTHKHTHTHTHTYIYIYIYIYI